MKSQKQYVTSRLVNLDLKLLIVSKAIIIVKSPFTLIALLIRIRHFIINIMKAWQYRTTPVPTR